MSLQHPRSDRNVFIGYQNINFMPPPPTSQLSHSNNTLGERVSRTCEMEFQILSPPLENTTKPNGFQPLESVGTERAGGWSEGYFGVVERKGVPLKFGEEEESNSSAAGKNGHTKLCARGHWRPAEDAKLKELVTQYGPQNWNLIAENLEGRSGKEKLTGTNLLKNVYTFIHSTWIDHHKEI